MSEEVLLARLPEWEEELGKITRDAITVEQVKWLQTTISVSDHYSRWPVDSLSPKASDWLMQVHGMLQEFVRAVGRDYGIRGVDLFSPYGDIKGEAWRDLRGAVAEKQSYTTPEAARGSGIIEVQDHDAGQYRCDNQWCTAKWAKRRFSLNQSSISKAHRGKIFGCSISPPRTAVVDGRKWQVFKLNELEMLASARTRAYGG